MSSVKCILAEQGGKGGGSSVQVGSITITTPPTKTSYLAGELFSPAGMVVTASYTLDGVPFSESEVTGACVFSPSTLTDGTNYVTVSYTDGNGVTVTTTQAVTVTHKLTAITATALPSKLTYEYGDTLNTAGLIVTASYSDNQTAAVTSSASCSPTALNTVGSQNITISYSENGVTVTTTFQVTVNRKTISIPTWKGTLTYNGSQQSANNTSLWNNFTNNMTIGGTITGTNAGSYNASFTPGANYRWPDGSTTATTVAWSIAQANGSVSLSPSTVAINASNYSTGINVAVTRSGTGTISWSNVPSGITLSLSGTTITVKGNGSTAVSNASITITVAASTNYKAATATLKVSAAYWSFGAGSGEAADATWWAGLSNYLAGNPSDTELNGYVGKTKTITLTSAIQGTTSHLVVCIGYNCDRDKSNTTRKTLTWQTLNTLATNTYFNGTGQAPYSSSATANASTDTNTMVWRYSYIRNTLCKNYYNALPFKASVKTVSKGTCTELNSSQSGTPTYTDEQVFLPSDCEMGFPAGHDYSNGKGYSASYNEFCQHNTSKTAYQYYNSNTRRIKKTGDSGSAYYYWERSLYYNDAYYACGVYSDGKPNYGSYGDSYGFAPAFVI